MIALLFFVIFINKSYGYIEPTHHICDILNEFVPENETLTIVTHTESKLLLSRFERPYMIFWVDKPSLLVAKYFDYYLVYIPEDIDYNAYMKLMKNSSFWHSHKSPLAKYLLILFNSKNIESIIRTSWENDITNLKFITIDNDTLTLFDASMYNEETMCGKHIKPILLKQLITNRDETTDYNSIFYNNDHEIYTTTTIQNYYGRSSYKNCNLTIGYVPTTHEPIQTVNTKKPGLIYHYGKILEETLGANIKYENQNFEGEFVRFGTIHKHVAKLNTKQVDLIPIYIVSTLFAEECALTESLYYDNTYWIVAKPGLISNIEVLMRIFNRMAWILILVAAVVAAIIYYFTNYLIGDVRKLDFWKYVLDICRITLSSSVQIKKIGIASNILLLCFMFYGLQITTFTQARLSSVLTKPEHEQGITSLNELAYSNKIPLIYNVTKAFIAPDELEYSKVLKSKAQLLNVSNGALDNLEYVVKNPQFSTFVYGFVLDTHKYYASKVNKFTDYMFSYMVIIFTTRKGHPMFNVFNTFINRFREYGIDEKWQSDWSATYFESKRTRVMLTLDHIKGALYILFVGYVIAFVIFLFEILFYFGRSKSRN